MSLCTVTWEMRNGKTLKCVYPFRFISATYHEPAESESGDPTYYIENVEIEFIRLPKGLDKIANDMYEGNIGYSVVDHNDVSMDSDPDQDHFEICDRWYDGR